MRRFAQVDVFTDVPGLGNPVAVVIDADGLDDATMARIATWTNLSETTFVLPPSQPGADYHVRIFTTAQELPMAGHPTLGTCRALLDAGVIDDDQQSWVQQTAAGPIEIRRDAEGRLRFAAPPPTVREPEVSPAQLGAALGGVHPRDPLVIDIGPHWLTARLTLEELDSLRPDVAAIAEIVAKTDAWPNLYAVDNAGTVHVRSIFTGPEGVLVEDPVCGSGNACVGFHLKRTGHAGDAGDGSGVGYPARQGRHRGRDGRIEVRLGDPEDPDRVWVGGAAVTVVSGTITI